MRLYRGKIETIAEELIRVLSKGGDIELENEQEARLDVESVLKEFLRLDREVVEEAKNRMESRGLGYSHLGQVRNQIAKERGFPSNEEVLPYLIDQILHILFHSNNVGEIFAADNELRKKTTQVLRKHMDMDTELDREVRSKIRNLQEGTTTFDVEYAKVMKQIKERKGL
jgi:uncharacterized protein